MMPLKRLRRTIVLSSLRACVLIAAFAPVVGVAVDSLPDVPAYVRHALADRTRPAAERKLDGDRKPALVLAYAGVRPGEIVAEFLPGGGYYTRLLSDIVGPMGKVYALETTTWGQENVDATKKVLADHGRDNVKLDLAPLGNFHLPEKVDLFFTALNYHDLHVPKYANVDIAAFNRQVFDALKPGGTYLIVDHSAKPGTGLNDSPTLHRIDQAKVVQEVTAAGFRLVGESDVLRNAADDRSKGVMDPAIRWHTDQFVLKFRRP